MGLRSQVVARKKEIQESARSRVKAKFSLSRNLRDAYFHAVTFAAFANDKGQPEILEDEKTALLRIGHDLGVGGGESARIFSHVLALVGSWHYNALLKDCLSQFEGVETYKKFLADFDAVFNLGNGATAKELEGWHDDFLKWLPEAVSSEYAREVERIAAEGKAKADAKSKELRRQLELQEKSAQQLVASFYQESLDSVKATVGAGGPISLEDLESARSALCVKGYGNVPMKDLIAVIHQSYLEEFRRMNADKPMKFLGVEVVDIFGEMFGDIKTGIKLMKEREIRRRVVWALACLYAVKKPLDVGVISFFNDLIRKADVTPVSPSFGNETFWNEVIARYDVMRWFAESDG